MIKLKDLLTEKVSGKNFKAKNSWYGMDQNSREEDFFDNVEWNLWKMFGNKKDPWNTEDKIKQQVNDFIVSIFDVMSDDEWLDKYTGLSDKAILNHAKRKGLKPIRKPIGESINEDTYTVYFDVGSPGLMSRNVDAKNEKEAAKKVASGLKGGEKLIKKVVKKAKGSERYANIRSKSVNEAPDHDLARGLKNINNDIFKLLLKYEDKADVDKAVHSWMLGLHAKLKKYGIKV
jgi:hypothetical protein